MSHIDMSAGRHRPEYINRGNHLAVHPRHIEAERANIYLNQTGRKLASRRDKFIGHQVDDDDDPSQSRSQEIALREAHVFFAEL
jgi:hypothetical protein